MTGMLLQTPLFEWHAAHGGRMVDFAGWSMPVQYSSIVAEHQATRRAVSLFDVSHMGRFRFEGPDSQSFLDRMVTRRVPGMRPGAIRYSLVTNQDGGILDDVLVYHLRGTGGQSYYQMVVNASNRHKIFDWLMDHKDGEDFELADATMETAMIAVQGPRALEIVRPLCTIDPGELLYYHGGENEISAAPAVISRTGYTGEDGCEIVLPDENAVELWEELYEAATRLGGGAAGLGARDTLRLEAGMPLYGHELSETINPYQAGLGFAVDLEGRDFPGHDVLVQLRDDVEQPRRTGLVLDGKRVPREGYRVWQRGQDVGVITSGTFSPTLERPIAMAYLAPESAISDQPLTIDIRGHHEPARRVELPLYRRAT
jgi:aminomethyltransferase